MATNIPEPFGLTYNERAFFTKYKVSFPKSPDLNKDIGLVGAELYQAAEEHDRLVLHFKGKPSERETTLSYGDPVIFEYQSGKAVYKFCGTIYQIDPKNTAQANNLDITCLSSSSDLKNTDQEIYKNVTADQVVSKIAAKNGMKAITQRHPRVRKSIVQAGQSYWQLLRRLAKQTGFALRAENTNIIFMSKDKIFQTKKKSAPYFTYVSGDNKTGTTTKAERLFGTIISFHPRVSDNSAEIATRVDRVITGVSQTSGEAIETLHTAKDYDEQSKGIVIPGEDYFE